MNTRYVEACLSADWVQASWHPRKGDYYWYTPARHILLIGDDDHALWAINNRGKKAFCLPRLDQLAESVSKRRPHSLCLHTVGGSAGARWCATTDHIDAMCYSDSPKMAVLMVLNELLGAPPLG